MPSAYSPRSLSEWQEELQGFVTDKNTFRLPHRPIKRSQRLEEGLPDGLGSRSSLTSSPSSSPYATEYSVIWILCKADFTALYCDRLAVWIVVVPSPAWLLDATSISNGLGGSSTNKLILLYPRQAASCPPVSVAPLEAGVPAAGAG
jgi:hypothetical protein